ncbi:MAG: hypothetical protein R3F33_09505 [Planctomycetota bacterium]
MALRPPRVRSSRPGALSTRGGFTIVELSVVVLLIGMMTYLVSASFESMVPGERLNTTVRNLAGVLREARREATTRNKPYYVLYDLDQNRYRVITPFVRGGGLFVAGYHNEEDRLLGDWEVPSEGVKINAVIIAGQRFEQGQALVQFDSAGSASEHSVLVSQPAYNNLFTVEVLALTGLIRFHEGLYERAAPQDGDFE